MDRGSQKDISQIHQRWIGYCEGSRVAKEVHNPVLIAVCSAVFDYLMQRVAKHQQKEQCDGDHVLLSLDQEEGVYYRFGGAALAAMLHLRYDQLKYGVHESKRESVRVEITILKAI